MPAATITPCPLIPRIISARVALHTGTLVHPELARSEAFEIIDDALRRALPDS